MVLPPEFAPLLAEWKTIDDGKVESLRFAAPLKAGIDYDAGVDFRVWAESLKTRGAHAFVVMMTETRLADEFWDDPEHMHITQHLLCSEIEEEARRRMENRYMSMEEVERVFAARGFPRQTYNWKPDPKREIEHRLVDAIFEAECLALYPELYEQFREACRWAYDEETDEEYELPKEAFAAAWEERRKEIFLPRVQAEYERVFPYTPEPFTFWDRRNAWQQFFFVVDQEHVRWDCGGSAGSGQRLTNGYLSHAFAHLESQCGLAVPSLKVEHTEHNHFRALEAWPHLRIFDRELSGNFKPPKDTDPQLFAGRLIPYRFESILPHASRSETPAAESSHV